MGFQRGTVLKIFAVLTFCFCLASPLFASEILFLKDGAVLYGRVVRDNNQFIVFKEQKSPGAKQYRRSRILRILYNQNEIKVSYIYKKDGTILTGFIVEENADGIIFRKELTDKNEISIPRKSIDSISAKRIESQKEYLFTVKKWGKKVAIEGDFTGWKPVPMDGQGDRKADRQGSWEKSLKIDILKKNEYQYRTVIDGEPGSMQFIKFKMEDGELVEEVNLVDFTLGLRVGAGMYAAGFADSLEMKQPVLQVTGKAHFLFLWKPLALQTEIGYFRHEPIKSATPAIEDYTSSTNNISLGAFGVLDFYFFSSLGIHPKLGGGVIFQSTEITGDVNDSLFNVVPFIGGGLELSWKINRFLNGVFVIQDNMFIEEGSMTHALSIALGVDFRL